MEKLRWEEETSVSETLGKRREEKRSEENRREEKKREEREDLTTVA